MQNVKNKGGSFITIMIASLLTGFIGGFLGSNLFQEQQIITSDGSGATRVVSITEADYIDAITETSESVVSIIVDQEQEATNVGGGFFIQSQPTTSSGTGFIINQDGTILTNKHVVGKENAKYTVIMNDGREFKAELIDVDPFEDIAAIRIVQGEEEAITFPALELGDSDNLQIGEPTFAIGNALGRYENSVTSGIISGKGRQITAFNEGSRNFENLSGLLQTDAAINFGNSGGPLINSEGKVIGMNVAVADAANSIGFAIPVNDLKPVIRSVEETGQIIKPVLGVRFLMLTAEQAQEMNASLDHGAILVPSEFGDDPAIVPESAADKAGLQAGDIIVSVDGIEVNEDSPLNKVVRNYLPGDEIELKIQREDQSLNIKAKLGSSKDLNS